MIDRIPNQDRGLATIAARGLQTDQRIGRELARPMGRMAMAVLVGTLPLMAGSPTARGDGHVVHDWEGNNQKLTLVSGSDERGVQVLINVKSWINVCGNTYQAADGGQMEFGANLLTPDLQLIARGPLLSDDEPSEPGGTDYNSGAITIRNAVNDRGREIAGEEGLPGLRVVVFKDRGGNQICQEVFPDGRIKSIVFQPAGTPVSTQVPEQTQVPANPTATAAAGGGPVSTQGSPDRGPGGCWIGGEYSGFVFRNGQWVQDSNYNAKWQPDCRRLWEPRLPNSSQRERHDVSPTIPVGNYVFNGVECDLRLDTARTGRGDSPITVGHGNGLPFSVQTADGGEAWAKVQCQGNAASGFEILKQ